MQGRPGGQPAGQGAVREGFWGRWGHAGLQRSQRSLDLSKTGRFGGFLFLVQFLEVEFTESKIQPLYKL